MPIHGNFITTNIQGEPYYKEYLEKVAKHQRYLAGEKGSDPDSPAPKSLRLPRSPSRESVNEGIPENEPRFDDEEAKVRMTLEGKKTWWLRLGARVYDSWKLQGDMEELWDKLAKLGAIIKMWKSLVDPWNS
nr:hypothetical protein [Tanacetum cinerariifolium]